MTVRKPITPQTLKAVAEELAGQPVSDEKAAQHAEIFENIMRMIERLRGLPIKDVEPAVIFRPVERPGDDAP
jgi:Asp-tRNA(Asn)/Glu-tRNA(Gln) amidotransferase C subunit